MTPAIQERVDKAEADFASALTLYRARKSPSFDVACFHAQQCAEKYLKARLLLGGISFTKTHDLTMLVTLAAAVEPLWMAMEPALRKLSAAAVMYRYPGNKATKQNAKDMIDTTKAFRLLARQSLGLP